MHSWETQILYISLAFIRATTTLLLVPFLGGSRLPMLLTISIAAGLALLAGPVASLSLPYSLLGLMLLAIKEALLGFLMSFAIYLVFFVIEFAMQMISGEIGFSMSHTLDPLSDRSQNSFESLFLYCVTLVFFITNTHHSIIIAFKNSFEYFPVYALGSFLNIPLLIRSTGHVFVMGLQIGAPLVATNFLVNITFFILGKAAPRINVFIISFAVRALAGFIVLLCITQLIFQYIQEEVLATPGRMLQTIAY
jgi:flagellar biosynthesis protein FliR